MSGLQKIIIGSIIGLGIVGFGFGISRRSKEEAGAKYMQSLFKKAVEISAGEDRIWALKEMREFFDYHGLKDMILMEDNNSVRFEHGEDFVAIVPGESGVFSAGSGFTYSYNKISKESLERYVSERGKSR